MPSQPTRPRDAASLVVVRGRGRSFEVLMGRREPRSRFMPSVWVFPGGGLDRADWAAPVETELRAAELRRLAHCAPARARALAIAALRETHEETGLAIGRERAGTLYPALDVLEYLGRAITPTRSHIRYHARFFLARTSRDDEAALRSNGELLDLRWVSFERALALPMINVTTAMLDLARARCSAPAASGARASLFIHFRGDTPRIRHEP